VPGRILFRYFLENFDSSWSQPVAAREAVYTNLGPGTYRFRLVASNSEGLWNGPETAITVNVAPAYYQTAWFRLSLAVALLTLIGALHQLRLRFLAQQFNARLDERVNERTRIARDLHDTLLQSFHGLLFRLQAAANLLPDRPADAKREFETAIDQAAQAITEGRDAVENLRSSAVVTKDLAETIGALGEELAAGIDGANTRPPVVEVAVEGAPRSLHPIVRDDIYRIAGEALRNAFRHASARRIEVGIRYGDRQFELHIRDDGKGIDPSRFAEPAPGHFGLPGMRERAERIGGHLDVWSEVGLGTELDLRIPASAAYARRLRGRLWPLFAGRTGTES